MELLLVVVSMVITLLAAALTVPAGFGLATMLTPVVLFWLPPHEAIAVVAIIHGAHNAWKFKKDPFYSNGFVPTVKELVNRIATGE